jgi:hypothetical protein
MTLDWSLDDDPRVRHTRHLPVEFLLAVAHDPTVSTEDRIEAVRIVAPYLLWCSLYTIEDGVPTISLRTLPTPEEWRAVQSLLRIYERGHTLTSLG